MKLLVISDVHANHHALEAVVAAEGDADRIICAGDLVDYGPFPGEVIDWFMAHDVLCVSGNHDKAVLDVYRSAHAEPAKREAPPYRWIHYNANRLEPHQAAYLAACPETAVFEVDGCWYLLTHQFGPAATYGTIQHLHAFDQFIEPHLAGTDPADRRVIFGHTHRQGIHYLAANRLWLNPGSLSYRRDDDPGRAAEYMTITDGNIAMKRLDYDRRPLLAAARSAPLTDPQREWALAHWS